jgi:hypothetical protein
MDRTKCEGTVKSCTDNFVEPIRELKETKTKQDWSLRNAPVSSWPSGSRSEDCPDIDWQRQAKKETIRKT